MSGEQIVFQISTVIDHHPVRLVSADVIGHRAASVAAIGLYGAFVLHGETITGN